MESMINTTFFVSDVILMPLPDSEEQQTEVTSGGSQKEN
jgi:hypothetical protein